MKSTNKSLMFTFILVVVFFTANAQSGKVPGVVVNYIPAHTKVYIGSPSICILPNGFGVGLEHCHLPV